MLNGNIFAELFLSDLDEKITFAGYERHPIKGNSETSLSIILPENIIISLVAFHTKTENTV